MATASRDWAIILATGTTATGPEDEPCAPAAFVRLGQDPPLLQQALAQIARFVAARRILVVANAQQAAEARSQLASHSEATLLEQPWDLGPPIASLLALAQIRRADPTARVTIFPANQRVKWPGVLDEALMRCRAIGIDKVGALLCAVPDGAFDWREWVVTGRPVSRDACAVQGLISDTQLAQLPASARAGALWNSGVLCGGVEPLWAAADRALPLQTLLMETCATHLERIGARLLRSTYERVPPAEWTGWLSAVPRLTAVPLSGAGWSAWRSAPELRAQCGAMTPRRRSAPSTGAGRRTASL